MQTQGIHMYTELPHSKIIMEINVKLAVAIAPVNKILAM